MDILEISDDSPLYNKAVSLRYKTFFRDFGLPVEVTCDDQEPDSRHFVIEDKEELIAYARLTPVGDNMYRLSQIVVTPSHQRKGFGKAILVHAMGAARKSGATKLYLNSQTSVQKLYERLGFKAEGESYQVKLTGVAHIKMTMTL